MVEKKKRKGNGSWSLVALFNQDFQRVAFNPPPPQKTQEGKKFHLTLEGLSLSSCKDYTVSHPLLFSQSSYLGRKKSHLTSWVKILTRQFLISYIIVPFFSFFLFKAWKASGGAAAGKLNHRR